MELKNAQVAVLTFMSCAFNQIIICELAGDCASE